MNEKGFSLIELIVIVLIMMALLVIAVPQFGAMSRKAAIERQTRQIYADLTTARSRAMNTNTAHVVTMPAALSYAISDGTNIVVSGKLSYNVTWSGSLPALTFNSRGLPSETGTITTNVSSGAVVDCINVNITRMTIGKLTGGTCVAQ